MKYFILDYPRDSKELGVVPQQESPSSPFYWDKPAFIYNQSRNVKLKSDTIVYDIRLRYRAKLTDYIDSYGSVGRLISAKVKQIFDSHLSSHSCQYFKVKVFHRKKEYLYFLMYVPWSNDVIDFTRSEFVVCSNNKPSSCKNLVLTSKDNLTDIDLSRFERIYINKLKLIEDAKNMHYFVTDIFILYGLKTRVVAKGNIVVSETIANAFVENKVTGISTYVIPDTKVVEV